MDEALLPELPDLCDSRIRIGADGVWWHGILPNLPSGQDHAAISGGAQSRPVASLQPSSSPPAHDARNEAAPGAARSRLTAGRNSTELLYTPFNRPELVKLFASILQREENGGYVLVTPVERCRVEVEDLPFIVTDMDVKGGIIIATLNTGEQVALGPEHALANDEKGPFVTLWRGLAARVSRPVYYRLAELAEESHDGGRQAWYVTSHGVTFELGSCDS
jgi:hypothetical protein